MRHLAALVARGILGTLVGKVEIALDAVNLLLVARLDAVQVVASTVTLADHVGKLEVLGLDVALHALHLVNRLLRRAGLELEALGLVEQVEVLRTEMRVELGEGLVLVLPDLNLLLQLRDKLVLAIHLSADVGANDGELVLQGLDTAVVLLKQHLVALKLAAHGQNLLLHLLSLALVGLLPLLVHLLAKQCLLGQALAFLLLAQQLGMLRFLASLLFLLAALLTLALGHESLLLALVLLKHAALLLNLALGSGWRVGARGWGSLLGWRR